MREYRSADMDWADIIVKIGVGACLGFGIIVLAKIGRKKNDRDQKTSNSAPGVKRDTISSSDTRIND
jgi:hypothetical protein